MKYARSGQSTVAAHRPRPACRSGQAAVPARGPGAGQL